MYNALVVVEVILGIILVTSVLLQPSKADALAGLIQGQSDTFFAKNKKRTKEAVLVKITAVSAFLFAVVTVALNVVK